MHLDWVVAVAAAQNLLENLRGFSITPVLVVQIRSFASFFFLLWNQPPPRPLSETCCLRSLHFMTPGVTFCISPSPQ